ncbi:MAG: DEAD/DEAH box helicase [Lentisphaerales bacterium]|nr:DEAD/DEAH box helicase [Lentisphaerales bacterium]
MFHLQSLGLGGILALDMGLGKTPTVLSLLLSRIKAGKPSLVIVPRSLIFNWEAEAERFTPALKLMVWRGVSRKKYFDKITDHHIILTTYGTLCRDAKLLSSVHFDYCILDESQAIKNSETSNAKAVRAVNSDYRIAMTGTPIETSISELWSQFEFLNPKMIGHAGSFKKINAKKEIVAHDELKKIAGALQPFMFRRTKEAVAKDLPGKSEVVLYCEMEKAQKKVYEELREYYRQEMMMGEEEQDASGTNPSSAMLAALMRLRQAACHPGLINNSYSSIPSAKIDMLINHLQQILAEGHKVLIFSQFTSMLTLVQNEIARLNIDCCYLDGQTSDRAAVVNEFQNNDLKKVFIISLKAGGVGLNLTAASYVFLIDPWWNPAIENQAIDRAYRIGQQKKVIAYRMVTKDTVEEKIMKMKSDKLKLAEQVTEHGGLKDSRVMGREVIEQLLR